VVEAALHEHEQPLVKIENGERGQQSGQLEPQRRAIDKKHQSRVGARDDADGTQVVEFLDGHKPSGS
jgi:hypothetical protein